MRQRSEKDGEGAMRQELAASSPVAKAIIQATFPGYRGRKPVQVMAATSHRIMDFWDGGSRRYAKFLRLADMAVVDSSAIPGELRQKQGNWFNLAIAEVPIPPGIAVVEHWVSGNNRTGSIWIFVNPESLPAIVEVHGASRSPKKLARLLEASRKPRPGRREYDASLA